jgi:hypothetical protein
VFQNLGSSLGTALVGSILIASLSGSFASAVEASTLPASVQTQVASQTQNGVQIVPISQVPHIAEKAGLSDADAKQLQQIYTDAQVGSLRVSLFALAVIAALALFFSRNIPATVLGGAKKPEEEAHPAS